MSEEDDELVALALAAVSDDVIDGSDDDELVVSALKEVGTEVAENNTVENTENAEKRKEEEEEDEKEGKSSAGKARKPAHDDAEYKADFDQASDVSSDELDDVRSIGSDELEGDYSLPTRGKITNKGEIDDIIAQAKSGKVPKRSTAADSTNTNTNANAKPSPDKSRRNFETSNGGGDIKQDGEDEEDNENDDEDGDNLGVLVDPRVGEFVSLPENTVAGKPGAVREQKQKPKPKTGKHKDLASWAIDTDSEGDEPNANDPNNDTNDIIDDDGDNNNGSANDHSPTTCCLGIASRPGFLVIGREDGKVQILQPAAKEKTHNGLSVLRKYGVFANLDTFAKSPISALAYSSDYIVAGSRVGDLHVFSGERWHRTDLSIPAHKGCVRDIAVDGSGIKFVSAGEDSLLLILDARSGAIADKLVGHRAPVVCVASSGPLIISGSRDGMVFLWSWTKALPLASFTAHPETAQLCGIGFLDPNASRIITAAQDGTIKVWTGKLPSYVEEKTLTAPGPIASVRVSDTHDQFALVVGSLSLVYDSSTLVSLASFRIPRSLGAPRTCAFTTNTSPELCVASHRGVSVWSLDIIDILLVATLHSDCGDLNACSMVTRRHPELDEEQIIAATGSSDGRVRIWDVTAAESVRSLKTESEVLSVALSEDAQLLAYVTEDCNLYLFSMARERLLGTHQQKDTIMSVHISADNSWLVTGGWDSYIHVYRLGDLAALSGPGRSSVSGAASGGGGGGGSGGAGSSFLTEIATLGGHEACVNQVRFLYRSNPAATSYRAATGGATKFSVAQQMNMAIAVSCSNDQTIKMWNLTSRECLRTISFHSQRSEVNCFDIFEDVLVSSCMNGKIFSCALTNTGAGENAAAAGAATAASASSSSSSLNPGSSATAAGANGEGLSDELIVLRRTLGRSSSIVNDSGNGLTKLIVTNATSVLELLYSDAGSVFSALTLIRNGSFVLFGDNKNMVHLCCIKTRAKIVTFKHSIAASPRYGMGSSASAAAAHGRDEDGKNGGGKSGKKTVVGCIGCMQDGFVFLVGSKGPGAQLNIMHLPEYYVQPAI